MVRASGKFVLRVDPELHQKLREASERSRISLNQLCVSQLAAAMASRQERKESEMFGIPLDSLRSFLDRSGISVIAGVLFGSISRGDATLSSDLDLLLVLPRGTEPAPEMYRAWQRELAPVLKSRTPYEISPQFAALPESWESAGSLWFEIALEGIILWETTREISSFLVQVRRAMAEGKLSRKLSHGHPFWIRNG